MCKPFSLLQRNLENGRLKIRETNSSVPVTVSPTVPVSCPPCSMTLTIVNPVGLTVSECSVTFTSSDPPLTSRTIHIRAVPTAGSNARVTALQFHPVDTYVSGSGWDDYIVRPITVSTRHTSLNVVCHHEFLTYRGSYAKPYKDAPYWDKATSNRHSCLSCYRQTFHSGEIQRIRSVERRICPIVKSTMTELLL